FSFDYQGHHLSLTKCEQTRSLTNRRLSGLLESAPASFGGPQSVFDGLLQRHRSAFAPRGYKSPVLRPFVGCRQELFMGDQLRKWRGNAKHLASRLSGSRQACCCLKLLVHAGDESQSFNTLRGYPLVACVAEER